MDENTPRALSVEEGVLALQQSREAAQVEEPEAEAEVEEAHTDEPDTDVEEVETDQADAEVEEEAEPEGDEPEESGDLYEVGDETFTLSELKEWKQNGLRQADYTKKTQQLSEDRKSFEGERSKWESERESVIDHLRQERAKLQDALATFAIEQDPEPSPDGLSWEDYTKRKTAWDKRQKKKQEAQQAYQAIAAEQNAEVVKRETAKLLQHIPEWRDPDVMKSSAEAIVRMSAEYGFSSDEMSYVTDHRILRVLNDLNRLKAEADTRKTSESVAAKQAVKAAKRLTPGAKPDPKNHASKELRQKRDQLKKTGSIADAAALLQARRAAG